MLFHSPDNIAITGAVVTNSNTNVGTNFTVTGTTTLTNGGFTDPDDVGTDLFVGTVSQSGTSAFNTTSTTTASKLIFRGGITNNGGTFTAGGATFNTNSPQSIQGNTAVSFANLVVLTAVTATNSNSASVTMSSTAAGTLSGTGAAVWTQDVNSTLNYAGATISG